MKPRHIIPFVIVLVFFSGVAYMLHSLIDLLRTVDMDVFP